MVRCEVEGQSGQGGEEDTTWGRGLDHVIGAVRVLQADDWGVVV